LWTAVTAGRTPWGLVPCDCESNNLYTMLHGATAAKGGGGKKSRVIGHVGGQKSPRFERGGRAC